MSPFLISHRFHIEEIREALAGRPDSLPLPALFWVAAERGRELLAREGVPPDRVVLCGPQRHAELVDFLAKCPQRESLRKALLAKVKGSEPCQVVMVVLGLREAENRSVLDIVQHLAELEPRLRVLVRAHPASSQSPQSMHPSIHWQLPSEKVFPFLAACDAVVTPGSTMAFEAMALGVFPIVHEDPTHFSFHSLADYSDCVYLTRSAEQLHQALRAITEGDEDAQTRRSRWRARLEAIFGSWEQPLDQWLQTAVTESMARVG